MRGFLHGVLATLVVQASLLTLAVECYRLGVLEELRARVATPALDLDPWAPPPVDVLPPPVPSAVDPIPPDLLRRMVAEPGSVRP